MKSKMVFVGDRYSSFVKRDYDILKEHFDIYFMQPPSKKIQWIKYIFILAVKIRKCDITFSWFASCESAVVIFFSKLFKKKSVVVVGGYDASYYPKIDYGAFINRKEKMAVIFVYKNVDKIIVVNYHLKDDIIKNAKVKGDNIYYLPTGHNSDYWKPEGKKENFVLTVAGIHDKKRVVLKGLHAFTNSAKSNKDIKFIIIGVKGEAKKYLEKISPTNVELIERLPEDKLLKYYQSAKVYCQLSYSEGLPTSLCESMLCECIPVGSKIRGIQSVIGDIGFYAEIGDEKTTIESIKKAFNSKSDIGKKARERIKKLYSENQRKVGLEKLVLEMIQ